MDDKLEYKNCFVQERPRNADYIKTLIQIALWNEYVRTGSNSYKALYDIWYEDFKEIEIRNL